jgi:urease accessory protein
MRTLAAAVASTVLVVMATPAAAHAVLGVTGFVGGLLHPLLMPSHLMAALALGLLIGQQGWGSGVPLMYAIAVCAGLGVIALGTVPRFAEETVLAAGGAVGLLVALAWRVLWVVGAGLAAVAGFALALDSPPEAISLAEAHLTLLGTALGAPVLVAAAAFVAARLCRDWQRIGMRIAGSWIAASAMLVLALRFLR